VLKILPISPLPTVNTGGKSYLVNYSISRITAISEIEVRIVRFRNIFGPNGMWEGGREKAPAALCRKLAETPQNSNIEIWGNGGKRDVFST
jgi:hypothetical protein